MDIHPRRLWLRKFHGDEIRTLTASFLPPPYDPNEILVGLRISNQDLAGSIDPSGADDHVNGHFNQSSGDSRRAFSEKTDASFNQSALTAAEATLLYGGGLFGKFQQVDEHVYEAMSRLAGENIQTMADLHSTLGDFKHDLLGELTQGALSKWKGHLAEAYAAEHFIEAGQNIEWPSASNQEGFDFLLNGHEVNVKLVADTSSIYEHFRAFPDIAAVVSPETSLGRLGDTAFHFDPHQSIEDALSEFLATDATHKVIVDHSLSAIDIGDQAKDAAELAIGGASSVEAHFPWITAATSTWREGRLLFEDKTDWKSAGKNLTADVAGKSGGAALGAKTGAVVGSMIAPGIGTAIGGVFGGILGALAGAKASDSFKRQDLEAAIANATDAELKFKAEAKRLETWGSGEYKSVQKAKEAELENIRRIHEVAVKKNYEELLRWRRKSAELDPDDYSEMLKSARLATQRLIKNLRFELDQRPWWQKWIWQDKVTVALQDAVTAMYIAERNFDAIDSERNKKTSRSLADVATVLAKYGVLRKELELKIKTIDDERKRKEAGFRSVIQSAYKVVADARVRALEELKRAAENIASKIKSDLDPLERNLEKHLKKVTAEKQKLGLDR